MKPFLKYPGGKSKEIPLVKKYMPKNINRYFEPFVGGGSIYLDLCIKDSFINDFSTDLINVYKYIKEGNTQFEECLKSFDKIWHLLDNYEFKENSLLEYSYFDIYTYNKHFNSSLKKKQKTIEKLTADGNIIDEKNFNDLVTTARKTSFYMLIRDLYNGINTDVILKTACYYFIREYCYSSMFRFSSKGKFNVPYGGMSYNSKYLTTKIEYIFAPETQEYLRHTEIYNLDFEAFLNLFNMNDNDFIFLDPPYDSNFSTYDKNTFDKTEQIRLRNYLKSSKAKWMLIIKKTDFITDLYKDFYTYEYDMNYMVSFKNRNNRNVEHLLITNYSIEE